MFSLVSFGKRRRHKSVSCKKAKKKIPSKALRRLARKLGVRVTLKRGHKRVYKSTACLKRQIKKKLALRKKHKKHSTRKGGKRVTARRAYKGLRRHRRRHAFGACGLAPSSELVASFGKRRRAAATSKNKAMVAFRKYYKRYCHPSTTKGMARRGRTVGRRAYMKHAFGYKPNLNSMAGYQFPCVLGPNSTGLYPTPCTRPGPQPGLLPGVVNPGGGPPSAFGRRVTRSRFGLRAPARRFW